MAAIALLLIVGLIWMMVRDNKAGPSRAFNSLKESATAGRCSDVYDDLSSAGRGEYKSESAACEGLSGFDWNSAHVATVRVENGSKAVVCVERPAGAGVSMRKEGGRWLADSPLPTPHEECVA